jgi:transposase
MPAKYIVTLTPEERTMLETLIASGTAPARKLTHARILLKADSAEGGPGWADEDIRAALDVSLPTIHRVRQQFVEEGPEAALCRRRPAGERTRKLDGVQEAQLIAVACSAPPDGQKRWSLRLLADRLVDLEVVDDVSHETIRQVLKKRTQALAEEGVVYPTEGERRVRLPHGRYPGSLHSAGGPAAPVGVLRRKQ